ncbi:peptidoglycan/LPS O-acetylase OafA/YrhL [Cryobacterium roopkundense]|uniref:Peptidoglycan/LPS O-acetylase OafA/YrhL n=2 Tax=Cryobacterium roopkundense TaxID=1001240 RepID=A0A7W9E476_9MICO|nr:peptidoglycan/LPS O-acetylase OafA/YrhL [Cryobacterium roopkundense]
MVAVVAVILDHLLGWPTGGFIGVDVFFVISGFLITGLLLRENATTGRISFPNFYRRRIRRILPVSTIVLVVTAIAAFLAFNSARAQAVFVDSLWSAFFAGNWRFASIGTDYFQSAGPVSPLQHYWSLAVEEQFYFIWPWLMIGIFVLARYRGLTSRYSHALVGSALALIVLLSFVWSVWETATNPTVAYFSTFSRAWELGVGALIAVGSAQLALIPNWARPVLAWVGLVGILVAVFVIGADDGFPAPWAALPVFSAALVIAAGTGGELRFLWPLTNRVSTYLGDISYSLYLWHFPVIVIGASLFGEGPVQQLLFAAVFLLASIYTFHLVEDPIRRSKWLESGRRTANGRARARRNKRPVTPSFGYKLMVLSLAVLVTGALAASAIALQKPPASSVTLPAPDTAGSSLSTDLPVDDSPPELKSLQAEISTALQATSWPSLSPTLDVAMVSAQAPSDVMWCGTHPVDESRCTWGDPQATHTAMTVGNSISMTYVEALRTAIGTDSDWDLISYGMFGCPFMDPADVASDSVEGCATRLQDATNAINRVQPDIVFVSGIGSSESVKSVLGQIVGPVKLVFLPGPPGDEDIHSCYTGTSVPLDCVSSVSPAWAATERNLAKELNQTYLDSSEWFCQRQLCPSFVGTTVSKMDGRHMTAEYARRIAPVIRESLVQKEIMPLEIR